MGWFRRGEREDRNRGRVDDDEWDEPERSLLEIEDDPEMRAAQADVDAEPLTPRSPEPDRYMPW